MDVMIGLVNVFYQRAQACLDERGWASLARMKTWLKAREEIIHAIGCMAVEEELQNEQV